MLVEKLRHNVKAKEEAQNTVLECFSKEDSSQGQAIVEALKKKSRENAAAFVSALYGFDDIWAWFLQPEDNEYVEQEAGDGETQSNSGG